MYKLRKALYDLKQASRAWNIKLNKILVGLNFHRCSEEPPLYKRQDKTSLLIVVVYVDDLLITGSSLSAINDFKKSMAIEFEMSDLGKLAYYLGIEVHQFDGGITLRQSQYAMKLLEESGKVSCNLTHAPVDFNVKLSKSPAKKNVDETEYKRNISCLRYLSHTRPDLLFSVGLLSRYMQEPKNHMVQH